MTADRKAPDQNVRLGQLMSTVNILGVPSTCRGQNGRILDGIKEYLRKYLFHCNDISFLEYRNFGCLHSC